MRTAYPNCYQEKIKNIEEKQKITQVLQRLGAAYAHLFMSSSKDTNMFALKVAEWQDSLGHYSYTALKDGITACKKQYLETVTLAQFVVCVKSAAKVRRERTLLENEYSGKCLVKLETSAEKQTRMKIGGAAINAMLAELNVENK